jgi:signal transduction histidine kinase
MEEQRTGQIVRWDACLAPDVETVTVKWDQIDRTNRGTYLFPAPGHSWFVAARRGWFTDPRDAVVLDEQGRRVFGAPVTVPHTFSAAHSARSLLAVSLPTSEWVGRVFVIDPAIRSGRHDTLRFAQRLVREVAPAVHNVYLMHRMRSRAEALERARLARDLHDGITQSLISAEMQVDLLRREAESGAPHIARELGRIRTLLRHEVLSLRDLMHQMKAFQVGPDQLLDHLADATHRFQRDTGVTARFVSNLRQDEIRLPPRTCREVAQVVHEGLVNIRKHSGARHVLVSLAAVNGHLKLSIDDDGCGFPFSGRMTQSELERLRKGPQVIKERARVIGGDLAIESTPGLGARLEITFR